MEKIEMTMPYGVEYIVSEEPEDYDVQITKKVSEEEEQKLDNGKKELSDILSENTDLTFTNTKEVQPATGIRQTSAPYMVMTGPHSECWHFSDWYTESANGRSDRRITSDKEHI